MKDLNPLIGQTGGNLRNVFSAHFNQKGIRFNHIDFFYRIVFDQLPDHAAVSSAYDENLFHIGMYRHGDMRNHFVINKFIPLRKHQIPVHYQDLPEIF